MDYTDIGHGMASFNSELWLYKTDHLETHNAATGTHNSIWGPAAMHCWRGRYDSQMRLLSVAPPVLEQLEMPPAALVGVLKVKFNFGDAYYFCDTGCRRLELIS